MDPIVNGVVVSRVYKQSDCVDQKAHARVETEETPVLLRCPVYRESSPC